MCELQTLNHSLCQHRIGTPTCKRKVFPNKHLRERLFLLRPPGAVSLLHCKRSFRTAYAAG